MLTCPRCGAANMPRDTTCFRCGNALRQAESDAPPDRNDDLQLPEWLRQPVSGPPAPPPAISTAPEPERDAPSKNLPPLPTGDLAAAMPDWLAAGSPAPRHPAEAVPPADLIDTTTFLSEEDLPEWIRRLAAVKSRPGEPERPDVPPAAVETGPLTPSPPPPVEFTDRAPEAIGAPGETAVSAAPRTPDVVPPARRSARVGYVMAAVAVVLLALVLLVYVL